MKTFTVALTALIIMIVLLSGYSIYIKKVEKEFIKTVDEISELVKKEDWDKVSKDFKKLVGEWDKKEALLSMLNDHEDLDEINLSINDLDKSISHKNKEHALKSLGEIKIKIQRLAENESFNLENILGLAHNRLSCHIML